MGTPYWSSVALRVDSSVPRCGVSSIACPSKCIGTCLDRVRDLGLDGLAMDDVFVWWAGGGLSTRWGLVAMNDVFVW